MKKLLLFMAAALTVAVVGCKPDEENKKDDENETEVTTLATPEITVSEITENSATVSWNSVENAVLYSYIINESGDTLTTEELSVALTGLTGGTEYKVQVRADADGNPLYANSEWAETTFSTTRFQPTSYTVYPMDPMVIMEYANLANAYVRNISPSGAYAVGFDDAFGDPTSFVWEKTTGEYTVLSPGNYDGCMAYDVNDEGIIVGAVISGSTSIPAYMDYKNGGSWTELPTNGLTSVAYPSFAASISNSGMIGGQVLTECGDGTTRCVPCHWKDYQLDQTMFAVPETGDDSMYGCYIYAMSEDGRVFSGWQDWGIGTRSPAVWVNGKLTRIYGETELIDEEGNIYEGAAWGISPDGTKVAGYFTLDMATITGFLYDVNTGEKEEFNDNYGGTAISADGTVFLTGSMGTGGAIYRNGAVEQLDAYWAGAEGTFATQISGEDLGTDGMLSAAYSVSSDGRVLGGSFIYTMFGTMLQYPVIIVFE